MTTRRYAIILGIWSVAGLVVIIYVDSWLKNYTIGGFLRYLRSVIKTIVIVLALLQEPSKAGCPAVAIPTRQAGAGSTSAFRQCRCEPPAPVFSIPSACAEASYPRHRQPYQSPYLAPFIVQLAPQALQSFGGFGSFGVGQPPDGAFDLRSSNENAAERRLRSFEADGGQGTFIGLTDARQKVLGF